MAELREVRVPDIGDFKNVPVIELLVAPGDRVSANMPLLVLESDKATLEVPSPEAGTVRELRVKLGDRLSEGALVLLLDASAEPGAPAQQESTPIKPPALVQAQAPAAVAALVSPIVRTPAADRPAGALLPRASPSVRRMARQLGVDLRRVVGSAAGERIVRDDVEAYVRAQLQRSMQPPAETAASSHGSALNLLPWPQIDHARFGPIERQPLSRVRKISGANLARNWVLIPHVTNFDEADVTELEAFRTQVNREQGEAGHKLTLLAFLIKVCARLLQQYPEFNSALDGDELVMKRYYNIGFAADTPNGLVVPVVRDADRKGLYEVASECAALAAQAREGKLKPADMQGGCFSISSLGGIGGTHFTPIINAPEVAILGVGRVQERLARKDSDIVTRLMLPLSLSWDHRVSDGARAARLLVDLSRHLADVRRVLL